MNNTDRALKYLCNNDINLIGCFLIFRKYNEFGQPLAKSLILYLDLRTGYIDNIQLQNRDVSLQKFSRFVDSSLFSLYNLFVSPLPSCEFKIESRDQRIKLYTEEMVEKKVTILIPDGLSLNTETIFFIL